MKQYLFAWKDKKTGSFEKLFQEVKELEVVKEEVTRSLTKCSKKEYKLSKDFSLYYFGIFDDKVGSFEIIEPEFVLDAADIENKGSEEAHDA